MTIPTNNWKEIIIVLDEIQILVIVNEHEEAHQIMEELLNAPYNIKTISVLADCAVIVNAAEFRSCVALMHIDIMRVE